MHVLAATAVMEKRYSGAYFTGPVRATHAPPQSNREYHSRRFFHGRAAKLTATKLAKPRPFGHVLNTVASSHLFIYFQKSNQALRHQTRSLLESCSVTSQR